MLLGLWMALGIGAAIAIALDFGWPRRRSEALTTGEALLWTLGWLAAALVFDVLVYAAYDPELLDLGPRLGRPLGGPRAATEFLTAFLVTKSLALTNVFVIALVLSAFSIPLEQQHRVLFWGLVGALALRLIFLLPGLALADLFAPAISLLGALLLLTSGFLMRGRLGRERPPPQRRLVSWLVRRMPLAEASDGRAFIVPTTHGWSITPLGLALIVILSSDLLFAVDALPAAFAVTRDPFLVMTSNLFSALGLRALYFLIAPLIGRFRPLEVSLVLVLAFVGVKSLAAMFHPIPTLVSLAIVSGLLVLGIATSLISARRRPIPPVSPVAGFEELIRFSLRHARRIVVTAVGATVLLVGVALLVLPGPGMLVIATGLALLSTEFVWARRWMQRIRREVDRHNPLRRTSSPPDPRRESEPRA